MNQISKDISIIISRLSRFELNVKLFTDRYINSAAPRRDRIREKGWTNILLRRSVRLTVKHPPP